MVPAPLEVTTAVLYSFLSASLGLSCSPLASVFTVILVVLYTLSLNLLTLELIMTVIVVVVIIIIIGF